NAPALEGRLRLYRRPRPRRPGKAPGAGAEGVVGFMGERGRSVEAGRRSLTQFAQTPNPPGLQTSSAVLGLIYVAPWTVRSIRAIPHSDPDIGVRFTQMRCDQGMAGELR